MSVFTREITSTGGLSDLAVVDNRQTEQAIKEILKGGTPRWLSHPEEYREYANETYLAEKEHSDELVEEYRLTDQDLLTDEASRLVNFTHIRDFVLKLRSHGVQCFTLWNRVEQQAGLWAIIPQKRQLGPQYICMVHIPYMPEWSLWRLDDHGLLNGEAARGWRTVLYHLIKNKVITEAQYKEWFGEPKGLPATLHKRDLYELRNGRG